MYNGIKIKYPLFPFKRKVNQKTFIIRNLSDHSINKNKSVDSDKYKDVIHLKQQLLNRTNLSGSSRNINPIISRLKFKSIAKSEILKKFSQSFYNYSSFNKSSTLNLSKSRTINKGINCDMSKNTDYSTPRNIFSVYYINSALNAKKKFISDLLINQKEDEKSKTQRVFDIEKKIKSLEKTLNLSEYTTRTSTFYKPKKKLKKLKEINKSNNSAPLGKSKKLTPNDKSKTPFINFKKIRDKYMLEKLNRCFKSDDSLENENKKQIIIDNKLNIVYSENLNIFRKKLKDINSKIIAEGKQVKLKPFYSPSERQLIGMKKKVNFMKNVLEYAFPNSEIAKLTEKAKKFRYTKYTDVAKHHNI